MTKRSIKVWYLVHKWTSLVCTLFMLLLCVTGLPLIFAHEIDHMLGYSVDPPAVKDVSARADVDAILADAAARRPDEAVQFLIADPHEPEFWFVRLGETIRSNEASSFFTYDARTGEFLSAYPLDEGFMNVMLRLHVDLYAGLPGTLFLGFMGLLLFVSLVSGTVLYGPFMRKLRFGTVRHDRSHRLQWLDLHNLVGIVTLVWLTVVTVTGVINTLSIPIFGQWQQTQLAEMIEPYRDRPPVEQGAAVERIVAASERAEPDMALSFLAFPGNGFAGPRHYTAFMQGSTPLTSTLLKPVLIDAADAEVVASRELPWYVTALLVSQPLHFGDYGGLPLKVLWALLDILAIVVLGSGLYLWIRRRNIPFETWLRMARGNGQADTAPAAVAAERAAGQ